MEKIDFGLSEIFGEGNNKLTATVTIKADINGVVSIDGSDVAFVKPGEPYQLECGIGQHIIKVSSEKHPEISKEIIQDLETPGKNYLVIVDGLASQIAKAEKSSSGFFSRLFGKAAPAKSPEDLYKEAADLKKQGKIKEYLDTLKQVANANNGEACYELAEYYGSPDVMDMKEFPKWLKQGAKAGHLHSMSDYSVYLVGKEQYSSAKKYAERPANAGYLDALAAMGISLYAEGTTNQDEDTLIKAFGYLERALHPEANNVKAKDGLDKQLVPFVELFLGALYLGTVSGLPKDINKAHSLIKSAQQHGGGAAAEQYLEMGRQQGFWR